MAQVDINKADPSPSRLRKTLGELTAKLGEVTVHRRPLSGRGLLYSTTTGLYFLPHHVDDGAESEARQTDVGQTAIWTVAAALWAPLALLMPLMQSHKANGADVPVYRPQLITPDESDQLPDLLMENPGAFFVPSGAVRTMRRRWWNWIIERNHGQKIKLQPTTMHAEFNQQMRALVETPPWQHVINI